MEKFATQQLAQEAVSLHLTNLAQGYIPPDTVYVADRLLPVIIDSPINFTYHDYEDRYFGQLADNTRARGAPADELVWDLSKQTGLTIPYSKFMRIEDRDRVLFGEAALEVSLTRQLAAHMKIQREKRVATLIEATGTYPSSSHYTTLSGTTQWSDFTNGNPETDIEAGKRQCLVAGSTPANTIHIPWEVASKVKQHPIIRELVKYSAKYDGFAGGDLNGLPPTLWELKVVVSRATYNSANPGQTQSNAFIWGKHVWIGYVNPVPTPMDQSFGYSFDAQPLWIKKGRMEFLDHADAIEASEDRLAKVISSASGYLIKNVIA